MEHICEFAISFDDKTIRQKIESKMYNDVKQYFISEAQKYIGGNLNYRNTWGRGCFDEMITESLQNVVEEYKDEIISQAAEMLAEKYGRTKAFKEKMGTTLDKMIEGE